MGKHALSSNPILGSTKMYTTFKAKKGKTKYYRANGFQKNNLPCGKLFHLIQIE